MIVGNKAPQPLMLQNIHRRNTLATTATNKSSHSQAVRVKHNVPTSSLQSEAQNVGPLMAVSSQDKPSSMTRSKPSITVSKWLQYLDNQSEAVKSCITSPDTPFMKTDSLEKSRADTGTSHEPSKEIGICFNLVCQCRIRVGKFQKNKSLSKKLCSLLHNTTRQNIIFLVHHNDILW